MGQIDICFVYCSPIDSESSTFATLPVKRMARACTDLPISFHVAYAGDINESLLSEVDVTPHRFDPPSIKGRTGRYMWLYRMTRHIVRSEGIDFVSNVWAHYDMLPVIAASGPSEVALRIVGDPLPDPKARAGFQQIKPQIGRFVEDIVLRLSEYAYFNSHTLHERFSPRLGEQCECEVISQGVDLKRFDPSYKYPSSSKFIFAGRLDSNKKGLGRLRRSFESFSNQNPNQEATLYLAGRGTLENEIRDRVRNLPDVEILGYLSHEELVEQYQSATALLLLSEEESLPNVVLEAMATGLPVIATDVGDIPRLLGCERGILITENGIEPVVKAMEKVTSNPNYREAMARKARSHVQSEHSFDSVKRSFSNLLL